MTNRTMMQYFHWYNEPGGKLWEELRMNAPALAALGINAMWLPPAFKAKDGGYSNGYDAYDLFDLGEFDQKGTVSTKFGSKEQYAGAVQTLHEHNILVYADVVLNHKGGADETESIQVRKVDPDNRNKFTSAPFTIEAHTKFNFKARNGKYSGFVWDFHCFSGIDYDAATQTSGIFKIVNEYGTGWEKIIDREKGNYDYLMFADIEFRNPAVREELKAWGAWYLDQIPFDGVRLDAIKHMSPEFCCEWLAHLRSFKPDLFAVGEYWSPGELPVLLEYLKVTKAAMALFDASLHGNFYAAATGGKDFDLSKIFDNTLVEAQPDAAVTLVDNHDTQPLQTMDSFVLPWFKPLAYALILLRQSGYPCIFYPDLYGARYTDKDKDGHQKNIVLEKCDSIEKLITARKLYAYGQQRYYFDHGNCIGWTRDGTDENEGSGCAVVLSNNGEAGKWMEMGKKFQGKIFIDMLGKYPGEVVINETGWGEFHVMPAAVSVWIPKDNSMH